MISKEEIERRCETLSTNLASMRLSRYNMTPEKLLREHEDVREFITENSLRNYEKCSSSVSYEKLIVLADLYGVSVSELIGDSIPFDKDVLSFMMDISKTDTEKFNKIQQIIRVLM